MNIQLQRDDTDGEEIDESLLANIDFSEIDTFDPNLEGAFREYCMIQVPAVVKLENSETLELLRVRILVQGGSQNPSEVKVTLDCDSDIFF